MTTVHDAKSVRMRFGHLLALTVRENPPLPPFAKGGEGGFCRAGLWRECANVVWSNLDVQDGLTHRERVVLWCLKELQEERNGRNVPTGMLYGTVVEVEYVDMSVEEMQSILVRLVGRE